MATCGSLGGGGVRDAGSSGPCSTTTEGSDSLGSIGTSGVGGGGVNEAEGASRSLGRVAGCLCGGALSLGFFVDVSFGEGADGVEVLDLAGSLNLSFSTSFAH